MYSVMLLRLPPPTSKIGMVTIDGTATFHEVRKPSWIRPPFNDEVHYLIFIESIPFFFVKKVCFLMEDMNAFDADTNSTNGAYYNGSRELFVFSITHSYVNMSSCSFVFF